MTDYSTEVVIRNTTPYCMYSVHHIIETDTLVKWIFRKMGRLKEKMFDMPTIKILADTGFCSRLSLVNILTRVFPQLRIAVEGIQAPAGEVK